MRGTSEYGIAPVEAQPRGKYLLALSLGALGVVYGDIGTSPLYAIRECFHGPHAIPVTHGNVLGVLSLIVWSLLVVVSAKYLAYVMRADLDGEGGILALMALACPAGERNQRGPLWMVLLGVFGAALLYGDGMITPAISVLSAVEGLEVAAPSLRRFVIPITIAILVGLFWFQNRGTEKVGRLFGPITLVWFLVLGALGIGGILHRPGVLAAVSPSYAVTFFLDNRLHGLVVLGAVFLVVTGGEAIYADMGHFGPRPIRITWFAVALPALLLNYFGQGALLLESPAAASSPFYRLAPEWALYPLVGLATAATVIASQAVISGAFSLSRQAIMLGYLPRLRIDHTSEREIGQIYSPAVNWALMVMTIALVLGFGSSSRLAAAYGIAVTGTMVITTVLAHRVARNVWRWPWWAAAAVTSVLVTMDLAFLGANLFKIADGGWFPLVMGAGVVVMMTTWNRGRALLAARIRDKTMPWTEFRETIPALIRVPGTAVYMTSSRDGTPPALVSNAHHNHVLHEQILLLNVRTEETPRVRRERRLEIEDVGHGCKRLTARYGFTESPDIPALLDLARRTGLRIESVTYVLGRETILATERRGMALWRERLFAFMARNAQRATAFFRIPPERVMEIGVQIEM
jgi:KUP system potassium uptake protein